MAKTDINGQHRIGRAMRQNDALTMRIEGLSYRQIAQRLSVSVSTAWDDVNEAVDEIRSDLRDSADRLVQLELERLDAMFNGLWPLASEGNTKAVNSALRVMERRAKLVGLDRQKNEPDVTGEVCIYRLELPDNGRGPH